jgi:hypothetical protein
VNDTPQIIAHKIILPLKKQIISNDTYQGDRLSCSLACAFFFFSAYDVRAFSPYCYTQ